jgi:hypothetical protein
MAQPNSEERLLQEEREKKIHEFEEFIENRLKVDLQKVTQARERLYEQMAK